MTINLQFDPRNDPLVLDTDSKTSTRISPIHKIKLCFWEGTEI